MTDDKELLTESLAEEKEAVETYQERAGDAQAPEVKGLFQELAADEKEHVEELDTQIRKDQNEEIELLLSEPSPSNCGFAIDSLMKVAPEDFHNPKIGIWIEEIETRCKLNLPNTKEAFKSLSAAYIRHEDGKDIWPFNPDEKFFAALFQDFAAGSGENA